MTFDNSAKTLPAGRHLFVIDTTTTVDSIETKGRYLKIETSSADLPRNWSDFSQFCPEPSGQTTTMVVVKDCTNEIDVSFIPKDADGLMDNFGNVYMAIEIND